MNSPTSIVVGSIKALADVSEHIRERSSAACSAAVSRGERIQAIGHENGSGRTSDLTGALEFRPGFAVATGQFAAVRNNLNRATRRSLRQHRVLERGCTL